MTLFPEGKLYINGTLRSAEGGAVYEDIGPWTGQVVGLAPDASTKDMHEAITAARRAFDESDWPGGVVSADEARALRAARRIRTGTVGINGGLSIDVDLQQRPDNSGGGASAASAG